MRNEPGDVFMYESEKQAEQAVYLQLEDIAGKLVEQAEKTVREVAERLAPISNEPHARGPEITPQEIQEAWPPHFSTMCDCLARVRCSLVDIRSLLDGTGL